MSEFILNFYQSSTHNLYGLLRVHTVQIDAFILFFHCVSYAKDLFLSTVLCSFILFSYLFSLLHIVSYLIFVVSCLSDLLSFSKKLFSLFMQSFGINSSLIVLLSFLLFDFSPVHSQKFVDDACIPEYSLVQVFLHNVILMMLLLIVVIHFPM